VHFTTDCTHVSFISDFPFPSDLLLRYFAPPTAHSKPHPPCPLYLPGAILRLSTKCLLKPLVRPASFTSLPQLSRLMKAPPKRSPGRRYASSEFSPYPHYPLEMNLTKILSATMYSVLASECSKRSLCDEIVVLRTNLFYLYKLQLCSVRIA
jgi:hypothetical protein